MGQYYKPINAKSKEWLYSHEYDNGMKLMEHSYIGNKFVNEVETLLTKGNSWYKNPIVWSGDYADAEEGTKENLYSICEENGKLKPKSKPLPKKFKYLVNHSKKEFVDKSKVGKDNDGWQIHPLPLLTCEGNGRGGGDFHGDNDYVGAWSRDIISVEDKAPKGYNEIKPNFSE